MICSMQLLPKDALFAAPAHISWHEVVTYQAVAAQLAVHTDAINWRPTSTQKQEEQRPR